MGNKNCRKCGTIFFTGMHYKHIYGLEKNACPECETDRFVADWK